MAERPNILVFMTDQQHHATLDAMPQLGRLRAGATHFRYAFCPTPICTPSRASVQTGLLPHRHRLMHNTHKRYHIVSDLDRSLPTLARELGRAGYSASYIGKWHVGKHLGPRAHGYEEHEQPQGRVGPWEGLTDAVTIPGEGPRSVVSAATAQPPEEHEAMRVAEAVCRRLRRHALTDGAQPLLLFASTTAPHVPWLCPAPYARLQTPEDIPRPASYDDDMAGRPLSYLRQHNMHNDCRMPGRWPDVARALGHYHGVIRLIDDAFGRVLDCLDETGLRSSTLVVFCSDHGEMAGAHARIGKGEYLLDEVVRTPLVIARPGGSARRTADEFVTLTDLYATLLAAGGAEGPAPPESRNLLPLLEAPGSFPDEVFLEHNGAMFHNSVRGIRTRRYKYVFRPHEQDELYDLAADPAECCNCTADPAHASALADLRRRLVEWMERTEDMAAAGARYVLFPPQPSKEATYADVARRA